jgi:hypothetical protein
LLGDGDAGHVQRQQIALPVVLGARGEHRREHVGQIGVVFVALLSGREARFAARPTSGKRATDNAGAVVTARLEGKVALVTGASSCH